MREDRVRHRRILNGAFGTVAEKRIEQVFAFEINAVPEEITADAIPQGINTLDGRLQEIIHGDKSAVVEAYAGIFKT